MLKEKISSPELRKKAWRVLVRELGVIDATKFVMSVEPGKGDSIDNGLFWKVPVNYTIPSKGTLGVVGYLLVDVSTGEIVRTIEDLEKIKENAEMLYRAETSQTK